MKIKIKQINDVLTNQGVRIIFHVMVASAVFALLAIANFFFTSPMDFFQRVHVTYLPTMVLLVYMIALLSIQMLVKNVLHRGYLFAGLCYVFYVFILWFYFDKDIIPMIILLSVVYAFMTQILMNNGVAMLFLMTALTASGLLLWQRNGQLLDIGVGVIMTLILVIVSAFYTTSRYIGLLKLYTDRIRAQVVDLMDSEERNSLLHKASRELMWNFDLETGVRHFGDTTDNEFAPQLSNSSDMAEWVRDVHPEDAEMLLELYREVAAGERDYFEAEFRRCDKNGEVTWYSAKTISQKDYSGRVVKMAGSYTWIHDRKIKELEIEYLAFNDELTELPNRSAFFRDISLFRELTGATGQCFLQYLDIQNFREINSTFGHGMGDVLIKSIARRLKALMPGLNIYKLTSTDFGIWGLGEEKEAVKAAREVLKIFDQAFDLEGNELFLQARLGISLYPSDAADAASLMRNADTSLYHCRKDEALRFMIYSPEMTNSVYNKMNMLNLMHQAVEKNEFFMVYQPLVRVFSGERALYGFEALIRWKSPQIGFVTPDQFIPLAEESGLIQSIGAWVLEESCGFIKEMAMRRPDIVVSVNISAKQFSAEDFLQILEDVVARTGIEPRNLCLEVTETSFIESFSEVQAKIQYIKEQGFLIALDDFGTGYSSLNYLGQLNIDTLKIDKSFTAKVVRGNSDFFLIKSIISLSRDLGLRFVAEGVETEEQLELLQSIGCPIVQGYLFAKPLPREVAMMYGDEL